MSSSLKNNRSVIRLLYDLLNKSGKSDEEIDEYLRSEEYCGECFNHLGDIENDDCENEEHKNYQDREEKEKDEDTPKCVECDEILSFGICENESCSMLNSTFHIETWPSDKRRV